MPSRLLVCLRLPTAIDLGIFPAGGVTAFAITDFVSLVWFMDGQALQRPGKGNNAAVTALVCIHTRVTNIHKSLKYHNHQADGFNLKAAISLQLTADD